MIFIDISPDNIINAITRILWALIGGQETKTKDNMLLVPSLLA